MKAPAVVLAALVTLQVVAPVPPTEAQLQAFVDTLSDIIRANEEFIPEAEKKLAAAKKAKLRPERARNVSAKEARERAKQKKEAAINYAAKQLEEAKQEIADAKAGIAPTSYLLLRRDDDHFAPLTVGAVGRLSNVKAELLQIGSADKALVTFRHDNGYPSLTVLVHMATGGLADDTPLEFGERVYSVTGTKQYGTALGAGRTVFVLQELDMAAVRREIIRRMNP
jgi:hypothetical protein